MFLFYFAFMTTMFSFSINIVLSIPCTQFITCDHSYFNIVDNILYNPLSSANCCNATVLDNAHIVYIAPNAFDSVNLVNLKLLSLNNNELTNIQPDTFKGLTNLLKLSLSSNKITYLEIGSFNFLDKVEDLDIRYNWLTVLQKDVFVGLPLLKYLDTSNSKIGSIDSGAFDVLPVLTQLILNSNPLSYFDNSNGKLFQYNT
eukprot:Pgem_evm1s11224